MCTHLFAAMTDLQQLKQELEQLATSLLPYGWCEPTVELDADFVLILKLKQCNMPCYVSIRIQPIRHCSLLDVLRHEPCHMSHLAYSALLGLANCSPLAGKDVLLTKLCQALAEQSKLAMPELTPEQLAKASKLSSSRLLCEYAWKLVERGNKQ